MAVLDEGLFNYLSTYSGLTALVSTRVYPFHMPDAAALPCVTFQRIDTPRELTHDTSGSGSDLAHPRFQFDAWATTLSSAKAINDVIRTALNGKMGTMGSVTIRAALVDNETPSYEPDTKIYRYMSEYIIWHVD